MYEIHSYLKKADILTFLNISLGFTALIFILNNNLDLAARFIVMAVVDDGFDGYFARRSNTESEFGMNFDSLSDCISFGVAPALLVYVYAAEWWVGIFCIAYIASGVLRLARYNVSFKDMEEGTFIGMPIPIGALMIVLAVFANLHVFLLVGAVFFVSYSMVCSINFAKVGGKRFPAHNLAILLLVTVPVTYIIPVSRIVFPVCIGGMLISKKRKRSETEP